MISLYDILEAADGQLFGEPVAQIFTDFAFDARQVEEGCLFVALKTERGDSHHQIQEAVARGALGVVCSQPPDFETDGVTVMIARNTEQTLMNWARIVLRKFGTTVIGVTGSVGRSTTKEAIAAVLGQRYEVYKNPGSYTGRLGLPLALGRLSAQHQLAVLELATDDVGEMAELIDITQPLVGVVTNIERVAVESSDDAAGARPPQTMLIEKLPDEGMAVLNYDDVLVRAVAERTRATVFSVGIDSFDSDLMAYNVVNGYSKTGFDLRYGSERYVGHWTPLVGQHQLYGLMGALAVGLSYQVALEEGLDALTQLEPLPGRLHRFDAVGGGLLVDDTFSASLQSTRAALAWLEAVRGEKGRLVFVLGDLEHLGSHPQRAHRQLGEDVARVADVFVTQGNLAAIAGRAALDYGMSHGQVHMTFSHHDTSAVLLQHNLGPDDIVLVKGGASARMERVVKALLANEADARLLPRQDAAWDQVWVEQPIRPSWVEVDLQGTAHNIRCLKEIIGPNVALMAMVQADACGHGAVAVGSTAMLNGAAYLGVASFAEAVELRDAGLDAPILVMGYTPAWAVRDALAYNLTATVYDLEMARLYNQVASDLGRVLRVHVQVDTGMGQVGLLPAQVTSFFRSLKGLKRLQVEGIYTELAAVQDEEYTQEQLDIFASVLNPVLATGLEVPYVHAANTAAAIRIPESRFTMVRAGMALHGIAPVSATPLPEGFQPTMQWKSVIAQIKELPPGSYVGEGKMYRALDTERIGILPVGCADGFRAGPHTWREVLVRGRRVPVVGQVGMHQAAINVTSLPEAQSGDEVVLIGRQGDEAITVEEVAGLLRTSIYEVLSAILARAPRL